MSDLKKIPFLFSLCVVVSDVRMYKCEKISKHIQPEYGQCNKIEKINSDIDQGCPGPGPRTRGPGP